MTTTTKTETTSEPAPKQEIPRMPGFEMPWPNPAAYEQWMSQARDTVARVQTSIQSYWDEVASYENAMYERAKTATADLHTLATDSLAYVNALTAEWRKASIEATRRVTETFSRS